MTTNKHSRRAWIKGLGILGLADAAKAASLRSAESAGELGFTRCYVAAFDSFVGPELLPYMKVGEVLTLASETQSGSDPHAVQVKWGEYLIGYIPKSDNERVSVHLKEGATLCARILQLDDDGSGFQAIQLEVSFSRDGSSLSNPCDSPALPGTPFSSGSFEAFAWRHPRFSQRWCWAAKQQFNPSQFPLCASETLHRIVAAKCGDMSHVDLTFSALPLESSDRIFSIAGFGEKLNVRGCDYWDKADRFNLPMGILVRLGSHLPPKTIYLRIDRVTNRNQFVDALLRRLSRNQIASAPEIS